MNNKTPDEPLKEKMDRRMKAYRQTPEGKARHPRAIQTLKCRVCGKDYLGVGNNGNCYSCNQELLHQKKQREKGVMI